MTSSVSSASASCFFNEPAELAYLSSCEYYHDPFFFPENKVVPIVVRETVFNTSTLTFEEIQPDDDECGILMCDDETPDSRMKYITQSCGCKSFICKSCLIQNLKTNNRFSVCPFCRNTNFCPTLAKQNIITTTGYKTTPITERMIKNYRKELDILDNLGKNGLYYRNNILDKDFKTLTAYERFYWNIHYAFVSDIGGDEYTDIEGANNFYISSHRYADGCPVIDNFNTPETTESLISSLVSIIVRNDEGRCYDALELNFFTENDIATVLADHIGEYPQSINSSFVFEYCITKDFRTVLGSENNDLWLSISSNSDNEDFLREMLRPNSEIIDAVKGHYLTHAWGQGDDIEEILGYKAILETYISHLVDGKEIKEGIWLCVSEGSVIYNTSQ